MLGLYTEIELALDALIQGLNYNFIEDVNLDEVDDEKMKALAKSKLEALSGAKKIINRWIDSPNRPSDIKIRKYVSDIVDGGEASITLLRKALSKEINFKNLEAHKHAAAISAKPVILESIFDIDSSLSELRDKLETGDLTFKEREFSLGYPELYANGSLIKTEYYKEKITVEGDVIIDANSTKGERIQLDDLGIILPAVPENKKEILFHNLVKKNQMWKRVEIPNITTSNIDDHKDFIVQEFKRRVEGVWFYNNGVPTYLTGNHYFALQYCKMLDDGGYMNYREAQRNLYYFMEACLVDPRALGMLFGKSRRTGFTYCSISTMLNRATKGKNGKHGLMSKSGTDGGEAFAKTSYMFLSLPFWLRPIVRGKLDSPNELYFGQPFDNSKERKKTKEINISDYLNTSMDWRNTKNGSYDSIKLDTYLLDEIFKIEAPNDVIVHLAMVSPTMMPNGRVTGKMLAGSTMGIHSKGGAQGVELIAGSHVKNRDEHTRKTATGLYFHFLPAQNNMEEFTDVYGRCWSKKPDIKIFNVFGEPIVSGSEDYLLAIEAQKKKQSDKAYNEQVRTYPRTIEHMMRDDSTESVYNMEKLYEQIEFNDKIPDETRFTTGNFDWVDGVEDGDVVFNPNSKGRFKVSWLPSIVDGTEGLANRVKEVNGKFYPLNKECVRIGVDPFSLKSTHGEGSKGAAHGLTIMFPEGGAPSNKFVFEYLARPADETIFFEDMIKVMRYYGAPALVESNRIDLLRHMRNRGYRGFSMNRLDRPHNKLNPNELEYGGQVMSGKDILDSHMNSIGAWVEKYVGKYTNEIEKLRGYDEMGDMPFNETLKDWLGFDPDKRTKFDATISSGLAVMACQTEKYKKNVVKKDLSKKVLPLLKRYNSSGDLGQLMR
jgi:hypothetical protein